MPLRLRRPSSQMSVNPPVVKTLTMEADQSSDTDNTQSSDVYEFENTKHPMEVLLCFNQLRERGLFTDVILSAGNREFPCHRAVLVAGSKYFRAMFCNDHKESREMLVQINGMQPHIMDLLLVYLYTSKAAIADNVQLLLEAANLFQILPLGEACTRFLEAQLDPCNCIGMREFAEAHALSALFSTASEMIMEKFADVVVHEEFLELPKMITMGGHVYCVGGYDGKNRLRSVERYDSFSNTWIEVAPLLHPVSSCGLATCHGKLYVIGGGDDDTSFNKLHCYNPETDRWSLRSPMPSLHKNLSAATINGKIYIIAGNEKSIHNYDPLTDDWSTDSVMVDRLESCGMTVCGGKLYITGGRGDGPDASDVVYGYDVTSGDMNHVSTMPRPSCFHGCVTIHRFGPTGDKA
uniref:BTB domain-containing protein n=1 Tax=Ciona savignyi TaxID=51511 RepID=H2YWC8_CIOSA